MRWQTQSELFRRIGGKQDCLGFDDSWFAEYGAGNADKSNTPVQSVYRRKPRKVGEIKVRSGIETGEFSYHR